MTTFNKVTPRRNQGTSPVVSWPVAGAPTHQGHPGYSRDAKSELFMAAVSTFGVEDTFYELGNDRLVRIVGLTRKVAVEDPIWLYRFVTWLRFGAYIRTVSYVIGLEGARALLDLPEPIPMTRAMTERLKGQGLVRCLAKAGIGRADEPGEALAYWVSRYGKSVPIGVKRGLGDRAAQCYTERSLLKYDTPTHGFRFGDVIELTHPTPSYPGQSDLFKFAMERRRNRGNGVPETLPMVYRNSFLREIASDQPLMLLNPDTLWQAGMTWEDTLSLAGSKLDKKLLWESMIPSMGYMALLRNLRNFDQSGVDDAFAEHVAQKLADPNEVRKSRQLPFRFLTAFQHSPSLRWSWTLEQALRHSLSNVPALSGNTLVLIDVSGSMHHMMSDSSVLRRWDAASLFGIALAQRCDWARVVAFSDSTSVFEVRKGESLLLAIQRWKTQGYNRGGGTQTLLALREHLPMFNFNRVVIVTDEQAAGGYTTSRNSTDFSHYLNRVNDVVPAQMPLHVINVAGYKQGMIPSGSENRHVYGGLGDHVFTLMKLVESGGAGTWPWEGSE